MIESKFEGNYFNGVSSRAIPCIVEPKRTGLAIYSDGSELIWKYDEVSNYEKRDNRNILKFGNKIPYPTLEVDSDTFYDSLKSVAFGEKFLKNPHVQFQAMGIKGILIGLGFIFFFLAGAYFVGIPLLMDGVASIFPRDLERKIGESVLESYVREATIDSARTETINKFYNNLQVDTDYKIHITVVESPVQNAFALPGGEIVVYSEILDEMGSYDNLVALLGHEVGHVQGRHSLRMMLKSLSNYILLSAIFQDFSGILAVLVDNAMMIERLSYSRNYESESDDFGYQVMMNNKVDPNGMIMLFEQLKSNDGDTSDFVTKTPEFLMTHPKLDERIKSVTQRISDQGEIEVRQNDSLEYYWNQLFINE